MKKLGVRLLLLALASVVPAQAWAKKLPDARRYTDGKEEQGAARMSVSRPVPRRVQGPDWGRSTVVQIGKGRGVSSPFIGN